MVEHAKRPEWDVSIGLDRVDRDPDFILATLLRDNGFPHDWDEDEKFIRFRVTSEGYDIWMYMLHRTPEIRALDNAWTIYSPRKVLKHCNWDDLSKRRVFALYWERYAQSCESAETKFEDSDQRNAAMRAARNAKRNMRRWLGQLTPLTHEEIKTLMEPVVNRVLAEVQSHGYVEYPQLE